MYFFKIENNNTYLNITMMAEDKNKIKEAELNEEQLDEVSGGANDPSAQTGKGELPTGGFTK